MNNADEVLKAIQKASEGQFSPIIGPQKAQVLIDIVRKTRPKSILEVGTFVGYSAILMAEYLPKGGKIITLEIDSDVAKIAKENIAKAKFSDIIDVIIGDAVKSLKKLKGQFDLLFIDAAKEEYFLYLQLAEPLLTPKAIVVADNVKMFANAMDDYLHYVRKSGKYKSKTYDFGYDAVEVSLLQ